MAKYTKEMNLHLAQIDKYYREGVIDLIDYEQQRNCDDRFYMIGSYNPNAFDIYKRLNDALELEKLCVVIASENEQVFSWNCISFPVDSVEEARTLIEDLEQSKAYKGMKVFFNYGFRYKDSLEELDESDFK